MTIAELVQAAHFESDFLGDLDGVDTIQQMRILCEISVDMVGENCPSGIRAAAVEALMAEGWKIKDQAAKDHADWLFDGIQSGDLTADGEPVPYPRYVGV